MFFRFFKNIFQTVVDIKMLSVLMSVNTQTHTNKATVYQCFPLSQRGPDTWLTAVNAADESWLRGSVMVPGGRLCRQRAMGWEGDGNRQGLPWSTGHPSAPPQRDRLVRKTHKETERGEKKPPGLLHVRCSTRDHLLRLSDSSHSYRDAWM